MASGSRPGGGGRAEHDEDPAPDARVTWHRSRVGEQVVLGVEDGGVRLAVAFPADASRDDLRATLAERDRELRHFFGTRDGRD